MEKTSLSSYSLIIKKKNTQIIDQCNKKVPIITNRSTCAIKLGTEQLFQISFQERYTSLLIFFSFFTYKFSQINLYNQEIPTIPVVGSKRLAADVYQHLSVSSHFLQIIGPSWRRVIHTTFA